MHIIPFLFMQKAAMSIHAAFFGGSPSMQLSVAAALSENHAGGIGIMTAFKCPTSLPEAVYIYS